MKQFSRNSSSSPLDESHSARSIQDAPCPARMSHSTPPEPLLGSAWLLAQSPSSSSSSSPAPNRTEITPSTCLSFTHFKTLLDSSRRVSDDAITTRLNRASALSGSARRFLRLLSSSILGSDIASLVLSPLLRLHNTPIIFLYLPTHPQYPTPAPTRQRTRLSTESSIERILRHRTLSLFFSRCPSFHPTGQWVPLRHAGDVDCTIITLAPPATRHPPKVRPPRLSPSLFARRRPSMLLRLAVVLVYGAVAVSLPLQPLRRRVRRAEPGTRTARMVGVASWTPWVSYWLAIPLEKRQASNKPTASASSVLSSSLVAPPSSSASTSVPFYSAPNTFTPTATGETAAPGSVITMTNSAGAGSYTDTFVYTAAATTVPPTGNVTNPAVPAASGGAGGVTDLQPNPTNLQAFQYSPPPPPTATRIALIPRSSSSTASHASPEVKLARAGAVMATGTFDPPLASRTFLPSSSSLSSPSSAPNSHSKDEASEQRIWFTYLPPTSTSLNDKEGGRDERVAEDGGEWEFTYRFRSKEGEVEWLGSAGGNGKIVVSSVSQDQAASGWNGPEGKEWTSPPAAGTERVRVGKFSRGTEGKEGNWDVEMKREWIGLDGWGEREVEGLVVEQSSRTWFAPRPLPRSSPSSILSHLSPTFPAQLLVLRFLPCQTDPWTRYTVLLPFSTRQTCAALVGVEGGEKMLLRCTKDAGGAQEGHLAIAWGEEGDLQTLIERCVAAARSVLSPSTSISSPSPLASFALKPLGACTWNALSRGGQTDYSATSLLSWLDSLRSSSSLAGEAIKTVLLDDGWQDTETYIDFSVGAGEGDREQGERRALKSFQCSMEWFDLDESSSDADEEGKEGKRTSVSLDSGYEGSPAVGRGGELPSQPREGVCVELREVVRRVKEMGVERVGVWMTLCGYWHGLHPDRSLADAYTLRRFTVHSAAHPSYNGHIYLPAQSDLRTFYDDYFSSLRAAGVDFVKVDDQATVDCLVAQEVGEDEEEGATPDAVSEYRFAMLEAMCAAAIDAFGADGIIHCMAGSPRIWGGSLGIVGATDDGAISTVRNSDDYFPDAPDSHRWHIALNAFTTLLSSALRFEPDFDMAQSAHEFGKAHLALRAFSTAQVWMSDEPGADLSGWEPLLAMTKQGVRVLQAGEGQIGTVLEGSVGNDVLGRLNGAQTGALNVGLPVASAKGARIGVWNCLPADRLVDQRLTTTIDSKDVADSLRSVAASGSGSFVLVDPATLSATQVDSTDIATASKLPHRLAKPLVQTQVAQNEANVLTVAQLFDLPAASSAKSVKIACLGLLDKTVGLAAIRSVEIISGKKTASGTGQAAETTVSSNASSGTASAERLLGSTSSLSTQSLTSSPNQTLIRPLSPTDRSSFPVPQGRVPFLLAYFAGFFRSSIVPNSSTSTSTASSRTPRTEIHSLARDILRQPVRTVLSEIKALVSFSIFTVFWIVGWRSNGTQRMIEANPALANASASTPAQSTSSDLSPEHKARLCIELEYLSDRLAFYVSPAPPSLSSLRLFLDGAPIDASVLHEVSSDAGIVEFQVESAWKGLKSQEGAGDGGKSQASEMEKPWVVQVDFAG
uniref:BY PROTMAP: gi/342318945/gb/EGU10900.1/ Proteophosphoglycan ppg4 [Rhodotorula glutinis ATCC 204091] n=1 Tax=Rhodotorula toruloides TaxID=5286 RepID=A0A0K3CVX5_RHOTO